MCIRDRYRAVRQAVSEGKKTLDYTFKTPVKDKDTFIELCRQAVYQLRRDYQESFLDNHTDFMYYYDQNGYNRVVFEFGYLNLSSKQKQELLDEGDRIVAQGKEKTSNTVELLQYFQEALRAKNEYCLLYTSLLFLKADRSTVGSRENLSADRKKWSRESRNTNDTNKPSKSGSDGYRDHPSDRCTCSY